MIPRMLRAILFDFSGVLVDDEPVHLELFRRVLAEEGVGLAAADFARRRGADDRSGFAALLAAAGEAATVPRLMRLTARKASYYQERIRREGYPFIPGAAALVRDLAGRGRMLGVVSGALREEVEGALRQEGLLDRFKVLVTAEDADADADADSGQGAGAGSPTPAGYQRALEALNARPPLPERLLHPHEVLAVAANPAGLAAAAEVGLATLGIRGAGGVRGVRGGRTDSRSGPPVADITVAGLDELTADRLEGLYAEVSRR
jgi:beta-phosphoglucomutase